MSWRLARSLETLLDEVNQRWPNRSKVSDGTVGDLAHSNRKSDHNPNGADVVRALDITAKGIDAARYAERIRLAGLEGHPALRAGAYVIFNGRAAYASNGWQWRRYTGPNPHTSHIHVSVGRDASAYDNRTRWGVLAVAAATQGAAATQTSTAPRPAQTAPRPPQKPEDFMATMSDKEKADLLADTNAAHLLAISCDQRLARLEASVHGTGPDNRGGSLWWRVRELHDELVAGANLARLRELLKR